ncbi:hypothetical protein VP01_2289g1 [Puccinia sorghi]|uniref:Uncharacterized protein n=1 Tax=Puccinia sorghi TaxID=27349 RepID=A0A0L6V833_9BASI|nr:hypothetical protein VP01_2289g1 [Puccinia sorghi]
MILPTCQVGRDLRWYYYICLLRLALVGSSLGMADEQTTFDITTTNSPFGASPPAPGTLGQQFFPVNHFSARGAKPGFVSAPGDGHLYIDGELFDFRSFNSPTMFDGAPFTSGEFETRDLAETISAFGSAVTRTYTLHVANTIFADGKQPSAQAHILGWNNYTNDWIYNETNWRNIDKASHVLTHRSIPRLFVQAPSISPTWSQTYHPTHQSSRHEINLPDYGSPDTDWVGNFNDLIRHRYNMRNYTEAQRRVDWFTDRAMISSFKQIITHFLNRINTYNGIRIGDDQTVLAIETGNEMNWAYGNWTTLQRPAPSNVTEFFFFFFFFWNTSGPSKLPSTSSLLLPGLWSWMEASISRNATMAWEDEVLDSPHMPDVGSKLEESDLKYANWKMAQVIPGFINTRLEERVRAHGKTFILGEHGFYDKVEVYESFYKNMTCAGALIWSLRPHSENGGFVTHGEGNNIYSYHAPGFRNQTSRNFDTQEADVVSSTYNASYRVLRLEPPPKPVPAPPEAFILTNGTHTGISWRGSAWAQQYEIYGAVVQGLRFNRICHSLTDNVDAGKLFVPLDPSDPTKPIDVKLPAPIPEESHAGWVDTKWRWAGVSTAGSFRTESAVTAEPDAEPPPFSEGRDAHQHVYWRLPTNSSSPPSTPHPDSTPFSGGWFSVRAISPDGVPGGISQSVFLTTGIHLSPP